MNTIMGNKKSDESMKHAKVFHDVFISYSRQDKDFARKLHNALEVLDREAWVDWTDIPPTAKWLSEIFEGIEAADTFICVLSPDYLTSSICAQEVEYAIKYKKRLIPIVYRDVKPNEVNPELAALNWIFFRTSDDFDDAFKKLIEALDTDLDYIRASSRLLVRAREWENNGYNASFTLRGNDLEKAEQWRDRATATDKKPSPSELQLRYITGSRRVATMRQRIAFGAVSIGLIVTLVLSMLSYTLYQGQQIATQQALNNLATAVSRQLATDADLQMASNPQLATLLSVAAFKTQDTPEARTSLMHQLDRVQHIDRFLSSNSGPINSVAYSPDGRIFASGTNTNVTFWDTVKGTPLGTLAGPARNIAFSPNGKILAVANQEKVILWDVALHSQLSTIPGNISALAFSPDGQTLALCNADNFKVIFWDIIKHTQSDLPLPKGSGVFSLAFSPDGSMLAADGSNGGDVLLWDVKNQSEIADLQGGHTRGVFSLAFSPDGKILASGGHDAKVVLWDVAQDTQIASFYANGDVNDLAFSPDGRTLATVDSGKSVILWDVVGQKQQIILTGHTAQVNSVAFNPDGQTLASGSNDTNVIIWRLVGKNKLSFGSLPTHNTVLSLAFSPNGHILAEGETDKVVLWDIVRHIQLVTLPAAARIVTFSPDGSMLATADSGNNVILWDATKYTRRAILTGHTTQIISLAFSPDGQTLASGAQESRIILWNTTRNEQRSILSLGDNNSDYVPSLAFSSDGKILASGSFSGIVLWDVAHHTKLATLNGHTLAGAVQSIAFSSDGHTFASTAEEDARTSLGCAGCKVIVWDLNRRTEVAEMAGHIHEPGSVNFSPDGRILVSTASDKAILWSVAQSAQITSLADGANQAVFSRDGRVLATANENEVDLWNFTTTSWLQTLCTVAGRDLTRQEWASYIPSGRAYQPVCRL